MFTKLFNAALVATLVITSATAEAQTLASAESMHKATTAEKRDTVYVVAKPAPAAPDTAWKPQRRVWGYAFGDFYYAGHARRGPQSNEGPMWFS